jgi:hypothetical protein
MCIGTESVKFTLKSRIKNLSGKNILQSQILLEPEELAKK